VALSKIYFDEDAMQTALVDALRSRRIIVITPLQVALGEGSDDEQLAFAAAQEAVLYTFDISDFRRLHTEWLTAGREHAGLLLLLSSASLSASSCAVSSEFRPGTIQGTMRNRLEFLSNW
jgi:hypothetical protein